MLQLNPFTVFIHVHFQALFQTARSALVSVSFVDRTTTLERQTDGQTDTEGEMGQTSSAVVFLSA